MANTRHAETGIKLKNERNRLCPNDDQDTLYRCLAKTTGEIAAHWIEQLKKRNVRSLIDDSNFSTHCYHKFVIEVDARDIVQRNLAICKIETKVHYAEPLGIASLSKASGQVQLVKSSLCTEQTLFEFAYLS
jgi:hypothetical protein